MRRYKYRKSPVFLTSQVKELALIKTDGILIEQ